MKWLRRFFLFVSGLIQFTLYSALFFAVMVGAGYWVALQFFGGTEVNAPDLSGLTMVDALQKLQSAHIALQLDHRQPHVQVPEGRVISQYPLAGSRIKSGTPIRVVVSSGQPLAVIPDLRGRNKIEAGIRLRKLGLEVGATASIQRPDAPPGSVLTTDPPAGTGVVTGTAVNLLLVAGQGTRVAQMPNLIGLTREEAHEVLESYGLSASEEIMRDAPDVPVGHIHEQSPSPGEALAANQRITFTIQPPRPDATPAPETDETSSDNGGAPRSTPGDTSKWPSSFFRDDRQPAAAPAMPPSETPAEPSPEPPAAAVPSDAPAATLPEATPAPATDSPPPAEAAPTPDAPSAALPPAVDLNPSSGQ